MCGQVLLVCCYADKILGRPRFADKAFQGRIKLSLAVTKVQLFGWKFFIVFNNVFGNEFVDHLMLSSSVKDIQLNVGNRPFRTKSAEFRSGHHELIFMQIC